MSEWVNKPNDHGAYFAGYVIPEYELVEIARHLIADDALVYARCRNSLSVSVLLSTHTEDHLGFAAQHSRN